MTRRMVVVVAALLLALAVATGPQRPSARYWCGWRGRPTVGGIGYTYWCGMVTR